MGGLPIGSRFASSCRIEPFISGADSAFDFKICRPLSSKFAHDPPEPPCVLGRLCIDGNFERATEQKLRSDPLLAVIGHHVIVGVLLRKLGRVIGDGRERELPRVFFCALVLFGSDDGHNFFGRPIGRPMSSKSRASAHSSSQSAVIRNISGSIIYNLQQML